MSARDLSIDRDLDQPGFVALTMYLLRFNETHVWITAYPMATAIRPARRCSTVTACPRVQIKPSLCGLQTSSKLEPATSHSS